MGNKKKNKDRAKNKAMLSSTEKHAIYFHLVFAAVTAAFLLAPTGPEIGWKIFLLLVVYNIALPVLGRRLGHDRWFDLWLFVFPLSLLQIFPDWFMSAVLNSLVFPDTGFPFIGTVGAYMGLMWSIPLFAILFVTWRARKNLSRAGAYVLVVVLTVVTFGIAEATLWVIPIWYAAPHILAPAYIAVYVIIGEAILGIAAWYAYQTVADRGIGSKLVAALAVMLIYTGAIAVSYLLVERTMRGVPGIQIEVSESVRALEVDPTGPTNPTNPTP
ncbi:MAG: hypothetical protein NXI24_08240 [bacterium]|nr:hypothetical protein [bacterium]